MAQTWVRTHARQSRATDRHGNKVEGDEAVHGPDLDRPRLKTVRGTRHMTQAHEGHGLIADTGKRQAKAHDRHGHKTGHGHRHTIIQSPRHSTGTQDKAPAHQPKHTHTTHKPA